jgi:hypothetical protein
VFLISGAVIFRECFVRVLHVGTSDERGSWFYATSVQLLIGRPGFSLLFNETGVENPTLQIVSSRDQNTESEEAQATPRATSAEYNPTYSQFISQINIMLRAAAELPSSPHDCSSVSKVLLEYGRLEGYQEVIYEAQQETGSTHTRQHREAANCWWIHPTIPNLAVVHLLLPPCRYGHSFGPLIV